MPSTERPKRKTRIGIVISDKMDKTITVSVDRVTHHPVYNKLMRKATKFKAHDEEGKAKEGDTVRIQETRPISKTKRWRLVEVVKKGSGPNETISGDQGLPQKKVVSSVQ
ncbi:MAG: 30S ribosomal protein S17 [Candidatus Omnitrophota bacterium]|nr:30S ribosomal protein S17 [Candidatus Omnitrophota bacterium]